MTKQNAIECGEGSIPWVEVEEGQSGDVMGGLGYQGASLTIDDHTLEPGDVFRGTGPNPFADGSEDFQPYRLVNLE